MRGPDKKDGLPELLEGLAAPLVSVLEAVREGVSHVVKEVNSPETQEAFMLFKKAGKQIGAGVLKELREKLVGIFLSIPGKMDIKHLRNQNRDAPAEHKTLDE